MAARKATGSVAESIRAFGVVLERVESQMSAVLEAVATTRHELQTQINASEARLSERISVLEQVVRQNSEDIRKNSEDIVALRGEVSDLRAEVARLRHDFDHREERGRMDALEARVAALETRLGVG
jgi:hypothetical protein